MYGKENLPLETRPAFTDADHLRREHLTTDEEGLLVLGNRLLLYPESGIRAVLDRNLRDVGDK